MSEAGHDLHSLFPDAGEVLHRLKLDNPVFQSVSDRYHELTREIVRIEEGVDVAGDARLEDMKKERIGLLDQISGMIAAGSAVSA